MPDQTDPFDELEAIQQLIVEKMAEIGIDVQLPVNFAKHPAGPRVIQLAGVMKDTNKVKTTLDEKDAFAAIVEAEKASEVEEKLAREAKAAEEALDALARMAEDDDDE